MENIEAVACMPAVAPARSEPGRIVAVRERLGAELCRAEELLQRDPDAAAIALDGALWCLVCAWYEARGLRPPAASDVLIDLDRRAPELAWRVRRALRAPHAAGRLARIRQALSACVQSGDRENGLQPGDRSAACAAERSSWRLAPGERPGA